MAEIMLDAVPRKTRDLVDKGFVAIERGNYDYAMDMLEAAIELEPRLLQARKYLRAAAAKKLSLQKSSAMGRQIRNLMNLPLQMQINMAIKKSPAKAMKLAERLLRTDPFNLPYLTLLAQAAESHGIPEVALQTLETLREHNPNSVPVLQWLGRLYTESGATQKARDCFEAVMQLRPNDQQALKDLKDASARETMNKSGWDQAGSFRDMIKDSKEAGQLEQEAKAVKSSSDIALLIPEFTAKIAREPQNLNYRRALAELYAKDNQFDLALQTLDDAQRLAGGADPEIDRTITTVTLKQFDAQIEALRTRGQAAAAQTREEERRAFLLDDALTRVKKYPNDLQFKFDLGVQQYERGQLNEAIQQFQTAQRNPQRRIRSLYYLALCFKDKKQFDIALEQLEKAAAELFVMDETKKDILYETGLICEAMGQGEKAAEYFKQIYANDIGYKDISKKIEQAYKR